MEIVWKISATVVKVACSWSVVADEQKTGLFWCTCFATAKTSGVMVLPSWTLLTKVAQNQIYLFIGTCEYNLNRNKNAWSLLTINRYEQTLHWAHLVLVEFLFFTLSALTFQVVSGEWITLKYVSLSSYQKQRLICFAWACLAGWSRMSCETRWRCDDVLGCCHLTGHWTCEKHSSVILIVVVSFLLQIPWRH